jgi:pyruvate formate lyase activating enzyme
MGRAASIGSLGRLSLELPRGMIARPSPGNGLPRKHPGADRGLDASRISCGTLRRVLRRAREIDASPGESVDYLWTMEHSGSDGRPPVRAGSNADLGIQGTIFDIQRFSLHDGPGIRTLVFMKGCPLRCEWCSNPESQKSRPELMFFEEKCIHCGACVEICPHAEVLKVQWPMAPEVCAGCGRCVGVCHAEARVIVGRTATVGEILEVIRRDRVFYEESHGGVTVGGGEPTLQAEFVAALLRRCRAEGLHTAIETCGYAPWARFRQVLEYVDLLQMDIKHMSSEEHRRKTGAGNEQILDNARKASRMVPEMVVRLPLIPEFNNDPPALHALGAFVRDELPGVRRLDLLPYHSTGQSKNTRLGREYALSGLAVLTREQIDDARAILESYGLSVRLGG